jgi:uncharacterized protein
MPVLIDGHNLIGQMTLIRLGEDDDEAQLVALLRRYVASTTARVIVVFDGGVKNHPQRLGTASVEVEFAVPPATADELLIRRINELRQPKHWQVVTSDREIAVVAKRRGVPVVPSAEFAGRLERGLRAPVQRPKPDEKPRLKVDKGEIPEWLELFGIDPEDAERVDLPLPPRKDFSKRKKRRR